MRKKTSISWFLIIVSMVMLVASVIPHHHHKSSFCLQKDQIETITACNSDGACNHDHSDATIPCGENTENECGECCITIFRCAEPDDSYDSMDPHYSLESIIFALTDVFILTYHTDECPVSHHHIYHEKLHSKHITEARGLRGPPCIIA